MARAAVRLGYLTPEEATAVVRRELGLPDTASAAQATGLVLGPNGAPVAAPTPTQSPVPGAGPDMLGVMGGGNISPGLSMPVAPTPPTPQGLPGGLNVLGGVGVPRPLPSPINQAV